MNPAWYPLMEKAGFTIIVINGRKVCIRRPI